MQVKKFEAPTIQEALENIKRELGPEAIILQTKKNKRGFGLMSKSSVEITAAVSDRSLQKKQNVETRLPEANRAAIRKFSAEKQANVFDKYTEKQLEKVKQTQDRVDIGNKNKKITATRYIDIEDDAKASKQSPSVQKEKKQEQPQAVVPAATSIPKAPTMTLEEEVRYLRQMIQELKNAQDSEKADYSQGETRAPNLLQHTALDIPALQDAFEQLVVNGVDRRHVLALIKKVAFELGPDRSKSVEQVLDLLASEIMDSVEVSSPFGSLKPANGGESRSPMVVALVGPTGVGKTATIAKLASELLSRKNLKVGLIHLGSQRTATFEHLGTYAKIINVPFRCAVSVNDFRAAISDFQNLDVVMVDTLGRSQRDPNSLREMQDFLKSVNGLRSFLVLSATTRDTELYDIANRFSIFRPQGIIVSKLDEATVFGSIYNLSQRVKIPLVYFTTGQTIPGDIEEATRERVAALVMEI